jgi:hypothetical protein
VIVLIGASYSTVSHAERAIAAAAHTNFKVCAGQFGITRAPTWPYRSHTKTTPK